MEVSREKINIQLACHFQGSPNYLTAERKLSKQHYQTEEELQKVVKCLQPLEITFKVAKWKDTKCRKAYIDFK